MHRFLVQFASPDSWKFYFPVCSPALVLRMSHLALRISTMLCASKTVVTCTSVSLFREACWFSSRQALINIFPYKIGPLVIVILLSTLSKQSRISETHWTSDFGDHLIIHCRHLWHTTESCSFWSNIRRGGKSRWISSYTSNKFAGRFVFRNWSNQAWLHTSNEWNFTGVSSVNYKEQGTIQLLTV